MPEEIPDIRESTKFNFVTSIWIVPIIAILIALWLVFQYFSELGPKITIIFESNEGLKAGQSQVKYRNVSIGKVEKVTINDSGEGVKVVARINKEAIDYLNDDSKFWIVKPEVGMRGISGLDTIFTGTYIEMSGKKSKMDKSKFVGLRHPYKSNEDGIYFHLNAISSYGVSEGTPVYFKNLKVGDVEHVSISIDGKSVDVIVYIDKNYVSYIHADTKFWIQSSFNIHYSNGQLNLNIAPISHIMRGGIEFSSSGSDTDRIVPKDYIFRLYSNSAVATDEKIGRGGRAIKDYYLEFNQSTAKLKRDASVKYDNFNIGQVKDLSYRYDNKTHKLGGEVLISIDTSIFFDPMDINHTGEENLEQAVRDGLRASLQKYDPITGLLYINLDFIESNKTIEIKHYGDYATLPTISDDSIGVIDNLNDLIDSIKKLPLNELIVSIDDAISNFSTILKENRDNTHQIMVNLNKTIESVNKMLGSKEFKNLPKELNKTMRELQKSLKSLDNILRSNGDESLLSSQLTQTLKELNKSSIDTQRLLKKLDRKPNALIFGD
jgi:paraquat-inducible protein B